MVSVGEQVLGTQARVEQKLGLREADEEGIPTLGRNAGKSLARIGMELGCQQAKRTWRTLIEGQPLLGEEGALLSESLFWGGVCLLASHFSALLGILLGHSLIHAFFGPVSAVLFAFLFLPIWYYSSSRSSSGYQSRMAILHLSLIVGFLEGGGGLTQTEDPEAPAFFLPPSPSLFFLLHAALTLRIITNFVQRRYIFMVFLLYATGLPLLCMNRAFSHSSPLFLPWLIAAELILVVDVQTKIVSLEKKRVIPQNWYLATVFPHLILQFLLHLTLARFNHPDQSDSEQPHNQTSSN